MGSLLSRQVVLPAAAVVLSLTACKLGKSGSDPETRPLPVVDPNSLAAKGADAGSTAAQPPSHAQAAAPTEPKAATPTEPAPSPAAANNAQPSQPAQARPATATAATTKPAPAASTPAKPAASTKTTTAATPSLPPIKAPSAQCLSRCAGLLQGCVKGDGGVVDMSAATRCNKAFEQCKQACQ